MSENVKEELRTAESTIEQVLHGLYEQGIPIFRVQLIINRRAAPSVTLIIDEKGGR